MSVQVIAFENDEATVISRDDGEVQVEFRETVTGDRNLVGIMTMSPRSAVGLGVTLIEKGQALLAAIAEQQRLTAPGVSD